MSLSDGTEALIEAVAVPRQPANRGLEEQS